MTTTRKNLRSFRLSAQAERQLAELQQALGTSLTETLTLAIDRMHRQEVAQMSFKEMVFDAEMGTEVSAEGGKDGNTVWYNTYDGKQIKVQYDKEGKALSAQVVGTAEVRFA